MNNYRTYIKINKKNIIFNIQSIKHSLKNQKICAVIKDNAYGHDMIKISKCISKYVDLFGVSTIEEAIKLSEHINKKILILGHIDNQKIKSAILNNIRLTISSFEQAKFINSIAKKYNKKAFIHIAINTGMNRIGFNISDSTIKTIVSLSKLENINLEGIFSHYSVADLYTENKKYKEFTDNQYNKFINLIKDLSRTGIHFNYTHIANSAGVILKLYNNTNLVRPGIILHGVYPNEKLQKYLKLKETLSLYSKIVHISDIKKGDSISYGNTFLAKKNMRIATLSIGYGDGYPRNLSNKQNVIINDKYCKIVGNITMDQLMVDITNVKAKVGDEVILIGKSKTKEIRIYELSKNSNILHYEIFCNLNARIPIIYK